MPSFHTTFVDHILRFLFPDRCAGCNHVGGLFCATCRTRLCPYPEPTTASALDGATIAWLFANPLQQVLHQFKYRKNRRLAVPLGTLLAEHMRTHPQPADAIIAVPLYAERLAERGFNQSAELAQVLAQHSRLPLLNAGLVRTRATEQQAKLNRTQRQANVHGAFAWRAPTPPPARVLLVDDVFTTGATITACAEALRAAGAREVRAIALARSRPVAGQHKQHS